MPSYPSYNRLMSLRLRRMARYGSIFKILHADPSVIDKTPDTDLVLFVLYSLNKQKRWEVLDHVSEAFMENLQELSYRMEVMVLERYMTDPFGAHWAHILPHFHHIMTGSKVKTMHSIPSKIDLKDQGSSSSYSTEKFRGNGRYINKTRHNKTYFEPNGMQIVTYHVVRAPKNFNKIFEHGFKNYKRPKDSTYHRKAQFDPMTTKIDFDEYVWAEFAYCCWDCEFGDFDLDYNWPQSVETLHQEPKKYYDLLEHVVERSQCKKKTKTGGFVFVE